LTALTVLGISTQPCYPSCERFTQTVPKILRYLFRWHSLTWSSSGKKTDRLSRNIVISGGNCGGVVFTFGGLGYSRITSEKSSTNNEVLMLAVWLSW